MGIREERALQELIACPFALSPSARKSAALRWPVDYAKEQMRRALDENNIDLATAIFMAAGHALILLSPSMSPNAFERALPHGRGLRKLENTCLAVLFAAQRSYRTLSAIVGTSTSLDRLRQEIWTLSFGPSLVHTLTLGPVLVDHDVLIVGETGTGKEAAANAIHAGALNQDKDGALGKAAPFATLNAAAVPDTLIESELFGFKKGAFTGATTSRLGRIRAADGGVFFLDEVGDLNGVAQAKLLRVMETDMVQPLGSDRGVQASVRYVSATHQNLESLIERGAFRRDLYQRIAGATIRIPPLRDRRDDIRTIAHGFLKRYEASNERSDQILEFFERPEVRAYAWPGNVREVQNALRSLLLGLEVELSGEEQETTENGSGDLSVPPSIKNGTAQLDDVTRWYSSLVLEQSDGNFSEAARRMGIDRATVKRHLES